MVGEHLRDEGFLISYRPLGDLVVAGTFDEGATGVIHLDVPRLQWGHVVAVDAYGVANPSDGWPERVSLVEFFAWCRGQGAQIDRDFLWVRQS